MPEGDTVWRTAERLHRALAGQPLTALELRWGDLGALDLLPATTTAVRARGKHLLHELDSGVTIHSHLKMEGSWRIAATAEVTRRTRANPQLRILAETAAWSALGLRLGLVEVWPSSESATRLAYLGPDILGPDWDPESAVANLHRQPATAIGVALLDQRNLAGIGTFWAAEALFRYRRNPWTAAAESTRDDLESLVEWTQGMMRRSAATGHQTSTGRTERDATAYVHGRSGRPCRRCGTTVRVAPLGQAPRERVFFYCPSCQGGLAPTDEGTTQVPLGASGVKSPRRRR